MSTPRRSTFPELTPEEVEQIVLFVRGYNEKLERQILRDWREEDETPGYRLERFRECLRYEKIRARREGRPFEVKGVDL